MVEKVRKLGEQGGSSVISRLDLGPWEIAGIYLLETFAFVPSHPPEYGKARYSIVSETRRWRMFYWVFVFL